MFPRDAIGCADRASIANENNATEGGLSAYADSNRLPGRSPID